MIDPRARAEEQTAPVFDDYTVLAHCAMTTHALYGDTTETARMIAADLRAFVRLKISENAP